MRIGEARECRWVTAGFAQYRMRFNPSSEIKYLAPGRHAREGEGSRGWAIPGRSRVCGKRVGTGRCFTTDKREAGRKANRQTRLNDDGCAATMLALGFSGRGTGGEGGFWMSVGQTWTFGHN
jgi:hypothetical protein